MQTEDLAADGEESIPQSYWLGQELDWEAEWEPVELFVELPFWLMVNDCSLQIVADSHSFNVDVRGEELEVHAGAILDSRASVVYVGAHPESMDPELLQQWQKEGVPLMARPCKTVLRIQSRCNKDVLAATQEDGRRSSTAHAYLMALCEAHLKVVNTLVQAYRRATYDFFPYEVSPWDVPIWRIASKEGFAQVALLNYAKWDTKPHMGPIDGPTQVYSLVEPSTLQEALAGVASAGELDLLDAISFRERGDYSGAVRRITTAIEAIAGAALENELLARYSPEEAKQKLAASRNNFPKRVRHYEQESGRVLPEVFRTDLERTRNIRHEIVHKARRIAFSERGSAYRAVDTGRWIYNWFENDAERKRIRETRLALRSVGQHHSIFDAHIEEGGVVVVKPDHGFLADDDEPPMGEDSGGHEA